MGRLSEFFNQHRDNVEDAVERALEKADNTIDSMSKRIEDLEQKLRDVAGDKSTNTYQTRDADLTRQNAEGQQDQGVVTSDQAAKRQTKTKR